MLIKNFLIVLSITCCYGISEILGDTFNDIIDTANLIRGKQHTTQNDQKPKIKSREFQPGLNNIVNSFKKPLEKPFGNLNQIVTGQKNSAKQLRQAHSQNDHKNENANENQLIIFARKLLISLGNGLAKLFSKIFLYLIDFAKKVLQSFNARTLDFNFFV